MIKTPPRVESEAFELYHHMVSTIGLFIVPVEPCHIRIWGFDPMMDQLAAIDPTELTSHKYELRALAQHCDLPCPAWLKSALHINEGYSPNNDEVNEIIECTAYRLGETFDVTRAYAGFFEPLDAD